MSETVDVMHADDGDNGSLEPPVMKPYRIVRRPKQKIIYVHEKRKKRGCLSLLCCCFRCCGPTCSSCLKWLIASFFLCVAVVIVAIVYLRESRSCCGGPVDLGLLYASMYDLEGYNDFVRSLHGNILKKNHLHRAYTSCVKLSSASDPSCYATLLTCMQHTVFPNWEDSL